MKKTPTEVARDKRRRENAAEARAVHTAPAAPKDDHTTAIATALTESKTASTALAKATAFVVQNNNDYAFVVESIAEIKDKASDVDALRRKWVNPLNEVIKSINDAFRPVSVSLAAAERVLKNKLVDFVNSQAVERDALIQDASAAVQSGPRGAKKADALLERAEAAVVPRLTGVQVRTTWTGTVVDADLIPREYMIPDEVALRKATVAKGGDPGIPGWKAQPVSSASINVDEVLGRGPARTEGE